MNVNTCGSGKTISATEFFSGETPPLLLTKEDLEQEWELVNQHAGHMDTDSLMELLTRPSFSEELHLAELLLKWNPSLLGIGEMRSEEEKRIDSEEAVETQ